MVYKYAIYGVAMVSSESAYVIYAKNFHEKTQKTQTPFLNM